MTEQPLKSRPSAGFGSRQHPGELDKLITRRVRCQYLLYLPGGERPEQGWPLMLYLHGAGERGDDLARVARHGPPRLIAAGQDLPFIVIAPQCPLEQVWDPQLLLTLLDEIQAGYDVDADRVYVTGLSMGGFGTWRLAIEQPERFAAIVPICGGGMPLLAHRLRHVPIWAFHGARDEVVPLLESQRMIDAVSKAGGSPRLTIYPDAGHDAWTATYDNPEVYAWMLRQRRHGDGVV